MASSRHLTIIAAIGSQACAAVAQLPATSVRVWGGANSDSAVHAVPAVEVAASAEATAIRRADGSVFVRGRVYQPVPTPPPGERYVAIAPGSCCIGLLSDGTLRQWGAWISSTQALPPTAPAGMPFKRIAAGETFAVAIRGDGSLAAWGTNHPTWQQLTVPTLPAGLSFVDVAVGDAFGVALVSDGSVRAWGATLWGVTAVPTLTTGITWAQLATGAAHCLGLQSDGQVQAWGNNTFGQCTPPPLPSGVVYTRVVAGDWHSFARRSDGQWVAFGDNGYGQCDIPPLPPGSHYVQMDGGDFHSVALRSDGEVVVFGTDQALHSSPPHLGDKRSFTKVALGAAHAIATVDDGTSAPWGFAPTILSLPLVLPLGVAAMDVAAGHSFSLVLGSDGLIRANGDNTFGQLNVPTLPPGVSYVGMGTGPNHAIAIRSDGTAIGFGQNNVGQCSVPPLPPGLSYLQADGGWNQSTLLRSDGLATRIGSSSWPGPPPPPAGTQFTQVAQGDSVGAALCSNGQVVTWGPVTLPPPSAGTVYVAVACGDFFVAARRSDGQVVTRHYLSWLQEPLEPPQLPPGRSYLSIDACQSSCAALVGPTSTYTSFGNGCAGTRPVSQLIPRDTPRLGRTLRVTVTELPLGAALFAFGWNRVPGGASLAPLGMPGCTAHVVPDAFVPLVGANGSAVFTLPLPFDGTLVGATFHQQAFVLDPNANALGAVLSDAATAVVGL